MKANVRLVPMVEKHQKVDQKMGEKKGIRYYVAKARTWMGRYVTVEKDAIFKDPNWPHLWDHEK